MLINTFLDTEDFVHLYYAEDEPATAQGCAANARMAHKYPRPPSPEYTQVQAQAQQPAMTERAPPPSPPPPRARAADLFPRPRAHYDEPGLDAGFAPICAEFVQWVGRTADGGTIAMSNYRLHLQPRRRCGQSVPLRLIDSLEIRDLLCLVILCKHGRQLKCSFGTGEQCAEWWRRLSAALAPLGAFADTFAAAYAAWARDQPAAAPRALLAAERAPRRHWFGPEVERLGFTETGAWRVSAANAEYKLCASYPPLLVVPAAIGDDELDSVARFRALRRVPAVVWRHRGSGGVLARSSQPEVGWLGWRSSEDERLLAAFVAACQRDRAHIAPHHHHAPAKAAKLLIVDARSYASAVTNRARGGGCECAQYYPHADIQFMCLPNIHHVRRSFHQMRALIADPADQANWHSSLERTLWLQYVAGVVRAGGVCARAAAAGRPVLVHCSDGWDRTPQIVAAAQLLLDAHYRTLEGFRVLIEREWLDFGHKFGDRCGHQFGAEDPNERSPIFLQWLDVVHQMMLQYPCSFEFNEAYLIKLATHVHSCMFGTFLCNSGRERIESRAAEAAHVWRLLRAPAYRNHLYAPPPHTHQMIWPDSSVRAMQLWTGMYCGERERERLVDAPPPAPAPAPTQHNGLMTKTRSCDNLLAEGERRSAQRRCSDPSLAPDVMKLSLVVNGTAGGVTSNVTSDVTNGVTSDVISGVTSNVMSNVTSDVMSNVTSDVMSNVTSDVMSNVTGGVTSNVMSDVTSGLTDSCVDDLLAPPAPPALPPPVLPTLPTMPTLTVDDTDTDQVDGLHPEHFVRGPASTSSSLERELAAPLALSSSPSPVVPTPCVALPPACNAPASPDEPAVFLGDAYTDVLGMADAAREASEAAEAASAGSVVTAGGAAGRSRHVSITWRSVSESSNHSSGTGEEAPRHAARTRRRRDHDHDHHHHDHDHNHDVNGGLSSESEGEARASQLTLCPSPRARRTARGACQPSAGDAACAWWAAGVRCVCGAGAGAGAAPDAVDGLPPVDDPLQARLHQIILHQKRVVEELSGQLREAREALRHAASPPAPAPAPAPHATRAGSSGGSVSASGSASASASASGSGSGSASGSGSEVEVGEEARGVVWLPDSAAPRCQHCRNHFWLARRRHHCRRCGGIFCGSCSEMSAWGECGAVRVCRRCRALR